MFFIRFQNIFGGKAVTQGRASQFEYCKKTLEICAEWFYIAIIVIRDLGLKYFMKENILFAFLFILKSRSAKITLEKMLDIS